MDPGRAGHPWITAGGDFDPIVLATTIVPAFDTPGWVNWDLTGVVSQWASGAASNYGVILRPSDGDWFGHLQLVPSY